MANRSISTFSIVFFVFFVSTFTANALLGGRSKIQDVKTNEQVQELGRYSVQEYNRLQANQKGGDLKFSKVIEAEKQVVAGMKYYLKIEAFSKSGDLKVFDAEVVVKPGRNSSKQLLNFKPSPVHK